MGNIGRYYYPYYNIPELLKLKNYAKKSEAISK